MEDKNEGKGVELVLTDILDAEGAIAHDESLASRALRFHCDNMRESHVSESMRRRTCEELLQKVTVGTLTERRPNSRMARLLVLWAEDL